MGGCFTTDYLTHHPLYHQPSAPMSPTSRRGILAAIMVLVVLMNCTKVLGDCCGQNSCIKDTPYPWDMENCCEDCTNVSTYCGYGSCNIFGCNCDGGCRGARGDDWCRHCEICSIHSKAHPSGRSGPDCCEIVPEFKCGGRCPVLAQGGSNSTTPALSSACAAELAGAVQEATAGVFGAYQRILGMDKASSGTQRMTSQGKCALGGSRIPRSALTGLAPNAKARLIFKCLDRNSDGSVSFTEACDNFDCRHKEPAKRGRTESTIKTQFARMDKDKNSRLSLRELDTPSA